MEKYKVLLVDDEAEVIEVIEQRIQWDDLGFTVVGNATNGVKALELVEKLQPDVVITDIKMPYMDGLTLCKKLKELYQKVKVIIFSGFDEFEYAKEAIKIEAEEYILKPIEREKITEILKKLNAEKNVTFLISSHMAGEIEKTCNKVAVIYESELIATSTTEDALRLHPSMEDYFLSVVKDRRGEIII